ncbi:PQQ repeat protein [Halobacterium hubeiense]|jgi:hypothetical protein|uniref:PQQ repeat protein n=2 Tax=Halobacterium TaxID=2239 RepID=A0A0U5H0M6_9EURY|nr:PQQ-binding-like beta-propeller repeat protein [Halobacterium hubeiense]CQH44886.1 PQQ repeat protein [Halobacterium hubeiense]
MASGPSPSSPPPSESSPRRSSRRAFLAGLGAVSATALAGCSALDGDAGPAPFPDGDWRTYGNGATNANYAAGGVPEPEAHTNLASGQWPQLPPVVHDGVVYFAADRAVVAVTPDGNEQWTCRLDVEACGAPALDPERGRLYVPTRVVPTQDGPDPAPASVTVLSLADGDIVATHRVGDGRTYGVTVADGDVYARSATSCVRLAPDGTERWRRSLTPLVYDEYNLGDSSATQIPPAVTDDGVYVPDRDALVKFDRETGDEQWRVPVDTPYAAAVVDDGGVVQTGWQETVAVTRSGDVRWRRDLQSRAAAAADGGDLYVVSGDLHEVDAETGETNWQAHLPSEGTAAPVVTDESVLAVAGSVYAFRRDAGGFLGPDRRRWRVAAVNATTHASPVLAAGRAFVVTLSRLVALSPETSD